MLLLLEMPITSYFNPNHDVFSVGANVDNLNKSLKVIICELYRRKLYFESLIGRCIHANLRSWVRATISYFIGSKMSKLYVKNASEPRQHRIRAKSSESKKQKSSSRFVLGDEETGDGV